MNIDCPLLIPLIQHSCISLRHTGLPEVKYSTKKRIDNKTKRYTYRERRSEIPALLFRVPIPSLRLPE